MNLNLPKGKLLINFNGPSGVGKDTMKNLLIEKDPALKTLVTATTREPRLGEQHGVEYYYLSQPEFAQKIAQQDMLEHSQHWGNYYGTIASVVKDEMEAGFDLIGDINYVGVAQLKNHIADNFLSFIVLPPDGKALADRLYERAKQTGESAEKIESRLATNAEDLANLNTPGYVFKGPDLAGATREDYDHLIINDDLTQAVNQVHDLIQEARKERG